MRHALYVRLAEEIKKRRKRREVREKKETETNRRPTACDLQNAGFFSIFFSFLLPLRALRSSSLAFLHRRKSPRACSSSFFPLVLFPHRSSRSPDSPSLRMPTRSFFCRTLSVPPFVAVLRSARGRRGAAVTQDMGAERGTRSEHAGITASTKSRG